MANVSELHVNGQKKPIDADAGRSLLSVLRDDLGLTGSKYGCGEGRCGACTVLLDGRRTHSCRTRVGAVGDKQVRTIEGLASGDKLHPLQEAFLEAGALQCRARSGPGSTSAPTAASPPTPARSRSGRTSARRSPRPSPRSSASRRLASAW